MNPSGSFTLRRCLSPLDREQACDIRRSVLCGELHLGREAARDAEDETAHLVLAFAGEKPVGTGRMVQRGDLLLVEHLSVLPMYRRQGLGGLMLAYFAQATEGSDLMAVAPSSAQAFFVACGFIVEKEDPPVLLLRRKA